MTTIAVEIPEVETEPGDDTEAMIEQVVAQAMASYGIDCGLIGAERVERHDDWSAYNVCPECGSDQFGESCIAHGWTTVSDGSVDTFENDHVDSSLVVECQNCNTVLKDSVIIE